MKKKITLDFVDEKVIELDVDLRSSNKHNKENLLWQTK